MTNTPTKNHRNFKTLKIGDSLKNVNNKFLQKFGKLEYVIHSKWGEIVGNFFVEHSEPLKIQSILEPNNNNEERKYLKYLHVNVTPSAAVEFQHFLNIIKEKINSYFGYKAIEGIKIHQKPISNKNVSGNNNKIKRSSNEIKYIKILEKSLKINDKKLEQSVMNLGLSIKNKEE